MFFVLGWGDFSAVRFTHICNENSVCQQESASRFHLTSFGSVESFCVWTLQRLTWHAVCPAVCLRPQCAAAHVTAAWTTQINRWYLHISMKTLLDSSEAEDEFVFASHRIKLTSLIHPIIYRNTSAARIQTQVYTQRSKNKSTKKLLPHLPLFKPSV